ncbi:hypothetical protein I316_00135 [Kwoniella heveanensis BCC8398]|uniref:Calpain catalytic domain-containing protein n=1 Tax=Kwoniella heveanensis BCC8398 TaxID=1296120 RepID=A0A1B9H3Q9_9TREE|nr:hypothetical protein I316_00135 [Kwoniella heveanensis BCC8398]
MRINSLLLHLLGISAMLKSTTACVGGPQVDGNHDNHSCGTTALLVRRDDSQDDGLAPLLPKNREQEGLPVSNLMDDVRNGDVYDSWWFTAVAGALIHTRGRESIESLIEDTGVGDGKADEPTDKAKFALRDYKGDPQKFEILAKDIPSGAGLCNRRHWFLIGLMMAAQRLGGFLGCDTDKIAWGSPVDAFMMLTGKKAILEQNRSAQQLRNRANAADKTPTIFGLGADPQRKGNFQPWRWYTLMKVDEAKDSDEDSKIMYWDAEYAYNRTVKIGDIWDSVRKIVYLDETLDY